MTLSTLITKLAEIQAIHGPEVEVFCNDQDGDSVSMSQVETASLYWDKPENGDMQVFIT